MPGGGSKRWCFTSFRIEAPIAFDARRMQYLCYGRETCPDTGRRHLQGYVVLKNRSTVKKLKLLDPGAHFEPARGSVADNLNYCSKDGDFTEFGEVPEEQGAQGGRANQARYADALDKARRGQLDDIDPAILIRCYHNIKKIEQDARLKRPVSDLRPGSTVGLWLTGPPGVGKSFYAKQFCREQRLSFYMKASLTKWWDGYSDQEIAIVEDVDMPAAKFLAHSIKIWTDEAAFYAETKGGTLFVRPRGIIVTSNYDIEMLWANDLVLCQAIRRRFHVVVVGKRDDFQNVGWEVPQRLDYNGGEAAAAAAIAEGVQALPNNNNGGAAAAANGVQALPNGAGNQTQDYASPSQTQATQTQTTSPRTPTSPTPPSPTPPSPRSPSPPPPMNVFVEDTPSSAYETTQSSSKRRRLSLTKKPQAVIVIPDSDDDIFEPSQSHATESKPSSTQLPRSFAVPPTQTTAVANSQSGGQRRRLSLSNRRLPENTEPATITTSTSVHESVVSFPMVTSQSTTGWISTTTTATSLYTTTRPPAGCKEKEPLRKAATSTNAQVAAAAQLWRTAKKPAWLERQDKMLNAMFDKLDDDLAIIQVANNPYFSDEEQNDI